MARMNIDKTRTGKNNLAQIMAVQLTRACLGSMHAHPFRSTSERSGAHMYHLFIDEIVEN